MALLVLFIAVPLIEIALFIQVGGAIGLWSTLAVVVVTAVLGAYLVREQGRQALEGLRTSFNQLDDPSEPLAHGAMILFSGALLLTPGFFTDALGFALLVPAFRKAAFRFLKSRVKVQSFQMGQASRPFGAGADDIIETEYHEVRDDTPPANSGGKPSGWTRH